MTTIEIVAQDGAKIGSTFYKHGALVTTEDWRADAAVGKGVAVYAEYSNFKLVKKGKAK